MFDSLRRLLGIAAAPSPESPGAFQQLNEVAPLKSAAKVDPATGANQKYSFVCREAVLNRDERIEGYEFALERGLQSRMLEKSALTRRVYDDAMLRNLAPLGVSSLLGHRFAFIHLSPASLKNPLLEAFSRMNVVVMITPGEVAVIDLAEVRADLQRLGKMGIKHGWKLNKSHPEIAEFLTGADFIELEATAFDGLELKTMYRQFRSLPGRPKLIVSELPTSDDFNLSYHCGFDYFMGSFVSDRNNWQPAKSEINRLRVFEVLNMVRSGVEFGAIADCLRTEPLLTFKLLRYINSPGMGLQQKIDDISQALMVLGLGRFYRWLSLLLFDFTKPSYQERVLNEQVLARARFMEMLAGKGRVPTDPDQVFLTGLFSLLDVMMDQPLENILNQVALPVPVAAALNGEPGEMLDVLMLAVAIESGTPGAMDAAAQQCSLDARSVTGAMVEALAWAHQISAAGE
ncbi:MAG: HDOD domain-containing protein [Nitrosomonadales bacterium]|nr:HDOD domain-containing protein [Nitrosomonadales bacterium]